MYVRQRRSQAHLTTSSMSSYSRAVRRVAAVPQSRSNQVVPALLEQRPRVGVRSFHQRLLGGRPDAWTAGRHGGELLAARSVEQPGGHDGLDQVTAHGHDPVADEEATERVAQRGGNRVTELVGQDEV